MMVSDKIVGDVKRLFLYSVFVVTIEIWIFFFSSPAFFKIFPSITEISLNNNKLCFHFPVKAERLSPTVFCNQYSNVLCFPFAK